MNHHFLPTDQWCCRRLAYLVDCNLAGVNAAFCLPVQVAAVCCTLLLASTLSADDFRGRGERLFEKEWTYEEPEYSQDKTLGALEELASNRRGAVRVALDVAADGTAARGDGLGPMHNATSCAACHVAGGGAGVEHNVTLLTLDPRLSFFQPLPQAEDADARQARSAAREKLTELFPALVRPDGTVSLDLVVPDKSTRPFYDAYRNELTKHVAYGVNDDWFQGASRTSDAIANQPVVAGRYGEIDFYLSQRNSPPLFGLGAIDSVHRSKLVRLARTQEKSPGDGVAGRIGAGKFGWRAQTPTLLAFVRNACAGELGLQSPGASQSADFADTSYQSPGLDMTSYDVNALGRFVASLPVPRQVIGKDQDPVEVREGQRLFAAIGCSTCHVKNVEPARGIYSDLLLHDMGELLQAPSPAPLGTDLRNVPLMRPIFFPTSSRSARIIPRRGSFSPSRFGYYGIPSDVVPMPYPFARPSKPFFPRGRLPQHLLTTTDQTQYSWDRLQREWRTPPLWGVADSGPYLHDGRAETLDAAIRWHGGEAKRSVTQYRSLTREKQQLVVLFLSTLRAPESKKLTPESDMFRYEDAEPATLASAR